MNKLRAFFEWYANTIFPLPETSLPVWFGLYVAWGLHHNRIVPGREELAIKFIMICFVCSVPFFFFLFGAVTDWWQNYKRGRAWE